MPPRVYKPARFLCTRTLNGRRCTGAFKNRSGLTQHINSIHTSPPKPLPRPPPVPSAEPPICPEIHEEFCDEDLIPLERAHSDNEEGSSDRLSSTPASVTQRSVLNQLQHHPILDGAHLFHSLPCSWS